MEGVGELAHVVNGASNRADDVVCGVGLQWWHLLCMQQFFFFFHVFRFYKVQFLVFFLLNIVQSTFI
jgi:hypothetical protein